MSTPDDIQRLRVNKFKDLDAHQDDLKKDPVLKEFIVTTKDDAVEKL